MINKSPLLCNGHMIEWMLREVSAMTAIDTFKRVTSDKLRNSEKVVIIPKVLGDQAREMLRGDKIPLSQLGHLHALCAGSPQAPTPDKFSDVLSRIAKLIGSATEHIKDAGTQGYRMVQMQTTLIGTRTQSLMEAKRELNILTASVLQPILNVAQAYLDQVKPEDQGTITLQQLIDGTGPKNWDKSPTLNDFIQKVKKNGGMVIPITNSDSTLLLPLLIASPDISLVSSYKDADGKTVNSPAIAVKNSAAFKNLFLTVTNDILRKTGEEDLKTLFPSISSLKITDADLNQPATAVIQKLLDLGNNGQQEISSENQKNMDELNQTKNVHNDLTNIIDKFYDWLARWSNQL